MANVRINDSIARAVARDKRSNDKRKARIREREIRDARATLVRYNLIPFAERPQFGQDGFISAAEHARIRALAKGTI